MHCPQPAHEGRRDKRIGGRGCEGGQVSGVDEGRSHLIQNLAFVDEEVDGLSRAEDHPGRLTIEYIGYVLVDQFEALVPLIALSDFAVLADEEFPAGVEQFALVDPAMDVVEQWLQQEGEDAVEQTVDGCHPAGAIGVHDGDDLAAVEGLHCLQDDCQPLQD